MANTIGRRQIHALLVYIGANDMGVAGTLTQLVTGDNRVIGDGIGDATANRKAVESAGLKNLADLPSRFDKLAAAIASLNVHHVYVTEYPTSLWDDSAGNAQRGCGIFVSDYKMDLSKRDAELVKDLTEKLNAAIKKAASDHNWTYISGIATDFKGHGYCRPDTGSAARYFVQAEESVGTQGDTEGTIHPNDRGHQAIGKRVDAALTRFTVNGARPGQTVGPTGGPGGLGVGVRSTRI